MTKTKSKPKPIQNETATTPQCPECSGAAVGRVDVVYGIAEITEIRADGTVDWTGDTEINWDSQRPAHKVPRLECMDCGHQAPASKFLPKGLKVDWE